MTSSSSYINITANNYIMPIIRNINKKDSNIINIEKNNKFEYGYQQKYKNGKITNDLLYFIKFYDWCTFDIDSNDYETLDKKLNNIIEKNPTYVFALYETTNGFHVHIMNKKLNYTSLEYKKLTQYLSADMYYYVFTKYRHGYALRLNKKNNNDKNVSRFVKYYTGFNGKILDTCKEYQDIYDNYLARF